MNSLRMCGRNGFVCLAVVIGALSSAAAAGPPTGREVAEKMHDAARSADSKSTVTMIITRRGQELIRKLRIFTQTSETGERRLFQFLEPAAVRDTKYLVWSYDDPERNDDIWVFLPSGGIVRRLSGGSRKGAFMRSDLAVEDLEKGYIDDHDFRLTGSEMIAGNDCYLLEMINRGESKYSRQLLWIRKDIWLPAQTEFYDRRGRHLKTARLEEYREIQGVWTIMKMTVNTPGKGSRTVLLYEDVVYDSNIDDGMFRKENLRR